MKKIFVSWHYTTHGIAYLKHVLSVFYSQNIALNKGINETGISQIAAQDIWGQPMNGFIFDFVYYITAPQGTFDNISNRKKYRREMVEDDAVRAAGLLQLWQAIIERDDVLSPNYSPDLSRDLAFVQEHFPMQLDSFLNLLWRDIHHYNINDQIDWFLNYSNAKDFYTPENFKIHDTQVKDLRDVREIADSIQRFLDELKNAFPQAHYFINISLGSSETQVVWHALSQAGKLPPNTTFLQTYDDKTYAEHPRFKSFSLQSVSVDIFRKISISPPFKGTRSLKRQISNLKMESFIKNGFSILMLGERGTGKSQLAQKNQSSRHHKFVSVNCASFDDDSKAESELFGYVKGAFTGAEKSGKEGLFQEANGGILFLDEIHHLSKRVQGKLMKALQTNDKNEFNIRPMGSNEEKKIRCTIIFATNRTIEELRETYLFEDFFDRITQNIIEMPALRDTPEDRTKDWQSTWKYLKFGEENDAPNDPVFVDWLNGLPLYGNFRDLQKIALYYYSFQKFSTALKEILPAKTAFDYTKFEFESLQSKSPIPYFDAHKSLKAMEDDFHRDLANWAITAFGSAENASQHFKTKGDKTTKETLYNWRNKKI